MRLIYRGANLGSLITPVKGTHAIQDRILVTLGEHCCMDGEAVSLLVGVPVQISGVSGPSIPRPLVSRGTELERGSLLPRNRVCRVPSPSSVVRSSS